MQGFSRMNRNLETVDSYFYENLLGTDQDLPFSENLPANWRNPSENNGQIAYIYSGKTDRIKMKQLLYVMYTWMRLQSL